MAPDLGSLSDILSELGVMDSNYLFCARLALASICITSIEAAPGNTESRSSCWQDFGCGRQSEMKCCSSSAVGSRPQPAAMRLHNGTADRQAHAGALWFGREECIEDLVRLLGRQTYAGVAN